MKKAIFLLLVLSFSFAGEASIARGGCIIETDAGNIDARLETQFKAIEECFRAVRLNDLTEG